MSRDPQTPPLDPARCSVGAITCALCQCVPNLFYPPPAANGAASDDRRPVHGASCQHLLCRACFATQAACPHPGCGALLGPCAFLAERSYTTLQGAIKVRCRFAGCEVTPALEKLVAHEDACPCRASPEHPVESGRAEPMEDDVGPAPLHTIGEHDAKLARKILSRRAHIKELTNDLADYTTLLQMTETARERCAEPLRRQLEIFGDGEASLVAGDPLPISRRLRELARVYFSSSHLETAHEIATRAFHMAALVWPPTAESRCAMTQALTVRIPASSHMYDYAGAFRDAACAEELDTTAPGFLVQCAMLCIGADRLAEASAYAERALTADPGDCAAVGLCGFLKAIQPGGAGETPEEKAQRYRDALAECDRAIEMMERDTHTGPVVPCLMSRAHARMVTGLDPAGAMADLAAVLQMRPRHSSTLRDMAEGGRPSFQARELAMDHLDASINCCPRYQRVSRIWRADMHRQAERHQEALDDLMHALLMNPTNVYTNSRIASNWWRLRSAEHSVAAFTLTVECVPDEPQGYVARASLYGYFAFEAAMADFDKALAIAAGPAPSSSGALGPLPSRAEILIERSRLLLARREYARALADTEEAINMLHTTDPAAYGNKLRALFGLARLREAFAWMEAHAHLITQEVVNTIASRLPPRLAISFLAVQARPRPAAGL